jgi:hypothetical protein
MFSRKSAFTILGAAFLWFGVAVDVHAQGWDPVVDGVNSVGDLVTNPVPTIGKGIGQILTGGKGLHPNTQNTDWGPADSSAPNQGSNQGPSLHAASQARANQAMLRKAKDDYFAAKDSWWRAVQSHSSPQQVAAAYQRMQAASDRWRHVIQQVSGQTSAPSIRPKTGKGSVAGGNGKGASSANQPRDGQRLGTTRPGTPTGKTHMSPAVQTAKIQSFHGGQSGQAGHSPSLRTGGGRVTTHRR